MMVDGARRSFAELDANTDRIANALLGSGISPGERVALWMSNSLEYVETYLACLKSGHVIVQLNIRHTEYEAAYQLEHSGAVALFFDDTTAERVERLSSLDAIHLRVGTGSELVGGAHSFGRFCGLGQAVPPSAAPGGEDLAVIAYTSGTTGFPKGAELTHRSIRTLGQSNIFTNRYSIQSTQIFALSLSFAAGIPAHVLPHLSVGGTTVIMPSWDTERLVDAIDRLRANFTILPGPPIIEFCEVVRSRRTQMDSLVSLLHSTAKAPEDHLRLLVETIGSRLVEGWGMTENSGGLVAATSAQDYEDRRPRIFSSTGRAAPETVVRLIDNDGEELPQDGQTVGQLIFHSGSLARGYWNDSAATDAAFRDGWYRSGDLGMIDPDGYIYVLDRRADLIISGGMNIYPSELEHVIMQFPGVTECAVIGITHDRWGQRPIAFVVRSDETVTTEAITRFCRERLAGYKQPDEIRFLSTLPKNAGGKVLRKALRDSIDYS